MFYYYTFVQNNSGGNFLSEKDKFSHFTIIEAESAEEATKKAKSLGIYFNGAADGTDCSCCGSRWYEIFEQDRAEKPEIYGRSIEEHQKNPCQWLNEENIVIHHMGGRIENIH